MYQPNPRILVLAILLTISLSSCYWGTALVRNVPGTHDARFFDNVNVPAAKQTFEFIEAHDESWGRKVEVTTMDEENFDLHNYLDQSPNLAMLVLRGDSILYEWYADDYDQRSRFPSFSMSKSFVSVLLGIAIGEGLIPGVDTKVSTYFPEFASDEDLKDLTIAHLINMTAGFEKRSSVLHPKAEATRFYYGKHLEDYVTDLHMIREPGTAFEYSPAASTQLLAFILEKASGQKISDYLHEKIWSQIGTEDAALWSQDRENGNVKAFCCLNARARDFARFGRLMLHQGNWEGKQIIPLDWVEKCTRIDSAYCEKIDWTKDRTKNRYRYHWWQGNCGMGDFRAIGLYGQMIHVFPHQDMIIVTLAKRKGFDLERVELALNYQIVEQFQERYAQNPD